MQPVLSPFGLGDEVVRLAIGRKIGGEAPIDGGLDAVFTDHTGRTDGNVEFFHRDLKSIVALLLAPMQNRPPNAEPA